MRALTYLIYILLWEGFVWGGTAYLVFAMDYSGWWFLLAWALSSSAYRPSHWIHGIQKEEKT